jgi:hypothetical protein
MKHGGTEAEIRVPAAYANFEGAVTVSGIFTTKTLEVYRQVAEIAPMVKVNEVVRPGMVDANSIPVRVLGEDEHLVSVTALPAQLKAVQKEVRRRLRKQKAAPVSR